LPEILGGGLKVFFLWGVPPKSSLDKSLETVSVFVFHTGRLKRTLPAALPNGNRLE